MEMSISKCIGLTCIPPEVGDCEQLEDLIMNKCKGITSLPDTVCEMKSLCMLDLRACKKLVSLPRQIGNLNNTLRFLDLRTCKRLETLPESLGQLTKLEYLDISDCVDLTIPKSLETFKDMAHGWDDEKVE